MVTERLFSDLQDNRRKLAGFGIDGVEHALIHSSGNINIPLQLQNKNITVLGHVRLLQSMLDQDTFQAIRAAKAEVREGLINSSMGWSVNEMGYIIGRHLSDSYQDLPLAFPALEGPQLRTTLVKGDDCLWYILELSEPLGAIVLLDAKFHDMVGNRSVITIVIEGQKYPIMIGFQFEGDGPQAAQFEVHDDPGDDFCLAPEDEIQGADISEREAPREGQQVGETQIVVRPASNDEVVVNGITSTANTYGVSIAGGTLTCFGRLLQHQRNLELQIITHAAQDALNSEIRTPKAPALPEPPSEILQEHSNHFF
jgi:hypothetical protein